MEMGVRLVLLTAIISGFSIFLNAFAVKGIDSSIFTFSKNLLVVFLLSGVLISLRAWKEITSLHRSQWLLLTLIGLIGGSIPFLLFFKGLQLSIGPTASFLHKSLFIYATIFSVLFLKERVNLKFIIPALLLLLGNFVFAAASG